LPQKFRFALDGRGGGCSAHDFSDQQVCGKCPGFGWIYTPSTMR
jgi:hypothetical protein